MKKSKWEKQYTSTRVKLLHNPDRLAEIKEGKFRPISIQLAPTDKCNLNCVFCSVKNREMKELPYDIATRGVYDLVLLGAKTIEITGGGDPTLYPDINRLINFCDGLGLKIGLISNGVSLDKNIEQEQLKKLTWLRISLNSLDYLRNIKLNIPDNVVLGFSYVWNEKSTRKRFDKILKYKEKYGAKYIRVVPDCRNVEFIEEYRETIMPMINSIEGVNGMFFQEKDYTPPERCWMGYLKPFLNSDGYVYHCSANPLIDLKFNEKFRMGRIVDIKQIWENPVPYCSENCGECFFKEHNELLEEILLDVEHEEFI
jgi:MoaA/NifB/PqqE/SkfB family radical SAM enzyme